MANPNAPFGLRPVKGQVSEENIQVNLYYAAAADATNIFVGDAVKSSGTATADGVAYVTSCSAGDTIRGVVVSVDPNPANLNVMYHPASSLQAIYVADDPYQVFEVQASATVAATNIGNNADITTAVSGSTFTGVSGQQLDTTTFNTTTAQLRLMGITQIGNNILGTNSICQVLINEHELKSTTGT